ncbi:16S rRNA (cytosine967-C5)-methyltransferase [Candidatus Planktophila versatilis]|uniref:16S rRNA (Cytosine967-C5)-methyltransferase n=1 Tax=Candidatus Planktophila versatilis TaxID=1884905 RepID=A0AAD0E6P8_9ACTN|nr:transcription antitermination factor NusB [Candidatus Planktophila versatilis]ASY22599.1 16S rRNA (cytosine967-C5)-methyltransferase [Candidatus Planktophila versatilis]
MISLVKPRRDTFKSPKPDAPRVLVFDLLTEVNRNGGYSNLLLPQALSASNFEMRDKGFVTELLYGTLRIQGRHDYILQQVSDRPLSEVDTGIVDICRMGVHQLFEMRVATHAAVSATVELARKVIGESKASFVNAILRKVSSQTLEQWLEPTSFITDPIAHLAIRYSHPEWIVSAYFDLLKDLDRVEEELAVNNVPAMPTLVAWPGDSTQSELVDLGGVATEYSPYGARFDGAPGTLEVIRHRKAGVQDEGSQLVAHIFSLATKDSSSLLDLCAGPGGKAALLAHLANVNGQEFTANEISEARAKLVKNVIGKFPVQVGDGREIASHGYTYDAILADVPCTGLGALRRRPEVRWRRTAQDLRGLLVLQRELSDAAISVLNPGGVFGYATCSPHFSETSGEVLRILKDHPELEQMDIAPFIPSNLEGATRDKSLSLWTSKHGTDAMFLALFRKRR